MSLINNISWIIISNFDINNFEKLLQKFNFKQLELKKYMVGRWKGVVSNIVLFEKKLLIQGNLKNENLEFLSEINSLDGLKLDPENEQKFLKLQPSTNAIICNVCKRPIFSIKAIHEQLDVNFQTECNHLFNCIPPFTILTIRILPDFSILIANSLSRVIKLGYFKGCEIVIPDFIFSAFEFFGGKKKSGAINEIEKLRNLEKKNLIKIINLELKALYESLKKEDFHKKEDEIILECAQISNSILITSDKGLSKLATLKKHPVIYISNEINNVLKKLV